MDGAANFTEREGTVEGAVEAAQVLLNSRKVLFGLQQKAFDEFGVDLRFRPRRPLTGCQMGVGDGGLILKPLQRCAHRRERRLALLSDLLIEFAFAIRHRFE